MNVDVLDPAKEDLANGYQFYEEQESGLGMIFLKSLLADIAKLAKIGGIHLVYHEPYHQMFSRKYPQAVYYFVENNTVFVDAVIDCRRDPDWIKERLN